MKKLLFCVLALLFLGSVNGNCQEVAEMIRLNSLGFFPNAEKQASITENAGRFAVKDAATNRVVYQGRATNPVMQEDLNQTVWTADFSSVKKTGTYYLEIQGKGRSVDFRIDEDVYNFAYVTSMRAFYLWRCGMEVSGDHNGIHYHQDSCHLSDGYEDYLDNPGFKRDGTQGWHDAGDFGKYTVNAGITVGILLMAWEYFQSQIESQKLNLPETAPGFPEFLKEIKWETDWLLKMPYSDGSGKVSHKLTRTNFAGFVMADTDKEKRYFTTWSSAATADFVAMMARTARVFKPYDAVYAKKCLDAAILSYNFLEKNPEDKRFVQGDFRTGGYQTTDPDDRLWAAAEMWETTGEAKYLADFEKRAGDMDFKVEENWDWSSVANLGMFTYALSKRSGKNSEVDNVIKQNIILSGNRIVDGINKDVYRRPLPGIYFWGCNGGVARQSVNLYAANQLAPNKKYEKAVLDIVGHLFGRNYYNRSYVTGLGINPPMFPHDRRSGSDGIEAPWPGYIVGGGRTATNWVDVQESYDTNEVAINWQAPLVFALAWLIK